MNSMMKKNFAKIGILFTLLAVLTMMPFPAQANEKINVNTATMEQLVTLPQIGEKTAADIIRHRDEVGPFKSIDELVTVKGIGAKKLEMLKDLVTVDE